MMGVLQAAGHGAKSEATRMEINKAPGGRAD